MALGGYQGVKRPLIVKPAEAEDQGLKFVVVRPARESLRQFRALRFDFVPWAGRHG